MKNAILALLTCLPMTVFSSSVFAVSPMTITSEEAKLCPQLAGNLRVSHSALSLPQAQELVDRVVKEHYPELKGFAISAREFDGEDSFLYSDVNVDSVFLDARERLYQVNLNRKIMQNPPSKQALVEILMHELSHIRDYTKMSSINFIAFAANYELLPIASYERKTDLVALRKGAGCGLMEFRFWLYGHIDEATTRQKQIDYFTPPEIAEWLEQH